VVAIYIAYVLPTFTRLLRNDFHPGPWNLGRFSKPIGWVAVLWVVFISILFVLPQATPITRDSFNYAGIVVFGAIFLLTIWWLPRISKWYKGFIVNGYEATLENIDSETNHESTYTEPSVTG
jgi:hypothetical protein